MRYFYAIAVFVLPALTMAQEDSLLIQEYEIYYAYVDSLEQQLNYDTGKIQLNDLAVLDLSDGYRYLNPTEADRILVESWNNPPSNTLGMIVPAGVNPYSFEGWGVVITYEEDGHIEDDDAGDIDFNSLLISMKEEIANANEIRLREGYEPYNLAGWAEQPYYDADSHKLYWALDLEFGQPGDAVKTLNYNVRVLGREGVIVLNAVAGMEQLGEVRTHMNEVLASTAFTEGNRYSDFDPSTDKAAAYGIGALVAGKIAAKSGFLKIAMGVLAKGWKFIRLLFAGIAAYVRKIWLGKKIKEKEFFDLFAVGNLNQIFQTMAIKKQYLKSKPSVKVTLTLPKKAAEDAKKVEVFGDFTNWKKGVPMTKLKNGNYKVVLDLEPEKEYQFRYLIDNKTWENDWDADKYVANGISLEDNSVIVL
ncbi:MAG: DUF2167 domain-containing protein [Cyclobacteriaceae bacterium]